jgi:hypothetical protein
MLGVITIFRLEQALSSKEDLNSYSSLKHYRHACSERRSLDDVLVLIVHQISEWFSSSSDSDSESDEANGNQAVKLPTRSSTRRTNVRNEYPWVKVTGHSPIRGVKAWYDAVPLNKDKKLIYDRRMECPGNPIYRGHYDDTVKEMDPKGKGARNKCALCPMQTNIWCSLCHTWLCGPHIDRKDSAGRDVVICLKYQEIYGYNTCWSMWHKPGIDGWIKSRKT